jgi:hypothetical protein
MNEKEQQLSNCIRDIYLDILEKQKRKKEVCWKIYCSVVGFTIIVFLVCGVLAYIYEESIFVLLAFIISFVSGIIQLLLLSAQWIDLGIS